jgi:hypothetical protein
VLVSSCGFWEKDNFDWLLGYMKRFCKSSEREFAGALLRPHSMVLMGMLKAGKAPVDIFAAAAEAGLQLVRDGEMSAENLKIISRPLIPREKFVQVANEKWREAIAAGKSPFA